MKELKFKGNDYVLVTPESDGKDGAIATKEQFINGLESYAYLNSNGNIFRFNKIIGTTNDIIFGDEIELEPTKKAMKSLKNPKWTGKS